MRKVMLTSKDGTTFHGEQAGHLRDLTAIILRKGADAGDGSWRAVQGGLFANVSGEVVEVELRASGAAPGGTHPDWIDAGLRHCAGGLTLDAGDGPFEAKVALADIGEDFLRDVAGSDSADGRSAILRAYATLMGLYEA